MHRKCHGRVIRELGCSLSNNQPMNFTKIKLYLPHQYRSDFFKLRDALQLGQHWIQVSDAFLSVAADASQQARP